MAGYQFPHRAAAPASAVACILLAHTRIILGAAGVHIMTGTSTDFFFQIPAHMGTLGA
jgi:hypothetical protein